MLFKLLVCIIHTDSNLPRIHTRPIQHIRQSRAPVFQRLPQPHQLRRNRCGIRSAQPHNPDAPASRRR
jgi:hypothetical protein